MNSVDFHLLSRSGTELWNLWVTATLMVSGVLVHVGLVLLANIGVLFVVISLVHSGDELATVALEFELSFSVDLASCPLRDVLDSGWL